MASEVDRVMGLLEDFTESLIIKISLDVHANLVAPPPQGGTPVDTGWARANWVPALGSPFEIDLSDVTPNAQLAARAVGIAQAGLQTLPGYDLDKGPVFITNNVPYILPLNFGSSSQAPAGFVQRAINKAITVDIRSIATPRR